MNYQQYILQYKYYKKLTSINIKCLWREISIGIIHFVCTFFGKFDDDDDDNDDEDDDELIPYMKPNYSLVLVLQKCKCNLPYIIPFFEDLENLSANFIII